MKKILKLSVIVLVVLLSDCKKPDDDQQEPSVPTTPDTEGNLAIFNETDESLYLYHHDTVVKEIPANTDNFIINISNPTGLSKELKIWKKSAISDPTSPPDNLLFRRWEVVLPTVATADERVSWVIQEDGETTTGTFSFNYPEFGNNNIPALYSVDVFLHNRTGSKITSVSPGAQGKKVGIEYGYHTVHYLYWYSDPNSTTGRVDIGWIDTDADGNIITYTINTNLPIREIPVPLYYDSPVGRAGEIQISNTSDQIVVIYANGNLIENIVIDTASTNGLSYIEPMYGFRFKIPENCYHLEARNPTTNAVLQTMDNLCVISQYTSSWTVSGNNDYKLLTITNNLNERITFHKCSNVTYNYLGFWVEPHTTITQKIKTGLDCILGINWDNTWQIYNDSIGSIWIIDDDEFYPTVKTYEVSNITLNSARSGGWIEHEGYQGYGSLSDRGVVWSTIPEPTIENNDGFTKDGTGTGWFTSNLEELQYGTTYYVRAYGTNEKGTAYGEELSFQTTPIGTPTISTTDASYITTTNAQSGGTITSAGNGIITAFGVCWNTTGNPTLQNSNDYTIDGSNAIGDFESYITGLIDGTTYYVAAYATNSVGTAYGNEITFATLLEPITPTVTTDNATNITQTTATSGGNVTSDGGASVTARGVCWSTSSNPTLANSHTTDGTGTGTFVSSITGLTENTTYYVRAYATNSVGTAYGNEITFATLLEPIAPTVTTDNATNITQTTATSGGNVTSDGGASVTARGVCWSTSSNPTLANSHTTDGTGTGTFVSSITGLTENTTYYVRAYATNSVGTAYGNEITFATLLEPITPTVTTDNATNITQTTATSGGNVTSDGGASVTARGVCWSTSSNPTLANSHTSDGTGTGTFVSSITGLTENTTYYVRAYATNSVGTAYGNEISFTTLFTPIVPTVSTDNITNITTMGATSGGNVSSNGGSEVTTRGVCWSTSSNPTTADDYTSDGTGTGSFISIIDGLASNTQYFVRAYAINSVGTAYGSEISFVTASTFQCADQIIYGGQYYNTVIIGSQCWLKENLNIGTLQYPTQGMSNNQILEKYCYNNDEAKCTEYGGLYEWFEMMQYIYQEGTQGICPDGWHLPSKTEVVGLINYLGGEDIAGGKMKETGFGHWNQPNTGATNSSDFTGLPGGFQSSNNSSFGGLNNGGNYWTSTENGSYAWRYSLSFDNDDVNQGLGNMDTGYSVRCIKD